MSTYTVPIKSATLGNLNVSAVGAAASTVSIMGSGSSYTWDSTGPSNIQPNTIQVKGDAVFEGKITWQGRDMREWFDSVESRLNILQPNPALEADWERLAELRQQYVELERELLEKQRVFDILKKL